MKRNSDIVEKLKEKYNGGNVITFAEFEKIFGTEYHFGGIEVLDILKGQDLCIIGTPNISDVVYQLYGMKIGKSTFYKLLHDGDLKGFKEGNRYKIPARSIEEYIDKKMKNQVF